VGCVFEQHGAIIIDDLDDLIDDGVVRQRKTATG
jgi:hypothetical protein